MSECLAKYGGGRLMLYAMLKAEIPNGDFEFSVPLADTEKLVEEVVAL